MMANQLGLAGASGRCITFKKKAVIELGLFFMTCFLLSVNSFFFALYNVVKVPESVAFVAFLKLLSSSFNSLPILFVVLE